MAALDQPPRREAQSKLWRRAQTRLHWRAKRKLQRKLQDLARPLPLGAGPKQSIIFDAMAQAESYLELKKANPNTSYPVTPRLKVGEDDRGAALDGLANSQSILEENEYRDLLAKLSRPGIPRPLNILKNRVSDGALILQDDKGRLLAFINLLPRTANRKRTVSLDGLMDTRTGEIMAGSTSGGDLFPLEGSRWHAEKFLSRGTLQASRLIYDGRDFYLAATFQFEAPVREPTAYLGVDRGIELLAAWAVLDENGEKIEDGFCSGSRLRQFQRREERQQRRVQQRGKIYSSRTRRMIADEEVHRTANEIVSAATKHNAQVVMEDLRTIAMGPHQARPKGARRGGWRRMLTRAQYMKLKHCVDYRLKIEGFAPIRRGQTSFIEVSPAYTSVTCSACGHRDKESRQGQAVFVCTKCGHKENADVNAAAMVAAKGKHFDDIVRGRRKGQKLRNDEQFSAWYATLKNGGGTHVS
jgi:IS605 OrfB family transposase